MVRNSKINFQAVMSWIPIAILTTTVSLLIYVVAQQSYRQSADDPQVQTSENAASFLVNTEIPQNSSNQIDMAKNLDLFVIIYNEMGKPVYTTVQLDGQVPPLPAGVLDSVKSKKQNRFTWQPKKGVRSAAVITYFSGKNKGYVLAGRSLREVEKRIDQLGILVLLGWIGTLVASFITVSILHISQHKKLS